MVSQWSGRHWKTFLEAVAAFWLSMGPWRATATPFVSQIVYFDGFRVLDLLLSSMFFFKIELLVRDRPPLTGVRQMQNDVLHLLDPGRGVYLSP